MSESDDELLILAAKAAGVAWRESNIEWGGLLIEGGAVWRPHTDDGDALRLSVNLMITIAQSPFGVEARILGGSITFEGWGDDRMAATRRAIVRAAAEIGKATASPMGKE
jgi:hypothetical protein